MDPNHKLWNQQQQALRQALKDPANYHRAIGLFLDQHAMVHSAVVSRTGLWSFEDEIWRGLTDDDIRQVPDNEEHSIAWLFWHLTRIEDITMNMLLAGSPQMLSTDGWFDQLGVSYCDTGNAMNRDAVVDLSILIDIPALHEYRIAISQNTRKIVSRLQGTELKKKVDPTRLNRVFADGAVVQEARGILEYWGGLTYAGLLLMPPTRHNFIHLNEALRLKKRMGRSNS